MRERWVTLPLGIQIAVLAEALLALWIMAGELPRVLTDLGNGAIGLVGLLFVSALVGYLVLMGLGLLTGNRLAFFLSGLGAFNLLVFGLLGLATGTLFQAVMGFVIGYGLWSGREAFLGPISSRRPSG